MDAAKGGGVKTAVSNPCFEVWLILHRSECAAWLTTDEAVARRRAGDPTAKGKHINAGAYVDQGLVEQACGRAMKLRVQHERNRTVFLDDNPSTSVDLLIAALVEAAEAINNRSVPR